MQLPINIDSVKGFLHPDEGKALYDYALEASQGKAIMEIGSYCGKSSIYLGTAAQQNQSTLFAVDHHRGSEEHQLGEEYHDPDVFDNDVQMIDTFKAFRWAMKEAHLEDTVVPVVAPSKVAAKHWHTPLGMLFIDGGHSMQAALDDYRSWAPQVALGGILAIHDLFPNPEEGGQAPITIWRMALASGLFEEIEVVGTLGLARRIA